MGEFKDYVEGARWDALTHAVKVGHKAYRNKIDQEKDKSEKKEIEEKVLSADGKELESIITKMVKKDYKFENGKIRKEPKVKYFTDWLKENAKVGA